ncbi:MAG: hypothetical protein MUE73_03020 [Planctomycetes bacterium]|jgi:hypothetical protein|nr:hypothetical protein [Planctomycetota bacterium]
MFRPALLILVMTLVARSAPAAIDEFLAGLRSADERRRREALEALVADPGCVPEADFPRARRALLDLLEGEARSDLRGLAARALATRRTAESDLRIVERLGRESDWRAQRPMLDALTGSVDAPLALLLEQRIFREPRLDVRILWIEALGRSDAPGAAAAIRRVAGIPLDWPLAQAAAIALSRFPEPETVDRLVEMLAGGDEAVCAAAHESLVKLTGMRSLPPRPAEWEAWWRERRAGFVFPGNAPPPDGEVRTVPTEGVTLPRYYDIPIRGRRVVFCLDASASMWGRKFEAAVVELSRAVRCLPTSYRFSVLFFNEHPVPWKEELVPAYPFQKLELLTTFSGLTTKKYTNIFDTLERALGFAGFGRYALAEPPGVDDVFLLSDGEPNRGRYRDTKGILAGLAELDPRHTVRIHTVSVGELPRELLAEVARARGGGHVHIEAPR